MKLPPAFLLPLAKHVTIAAVLFCGVLFSGCATQGGIRTIRVKALSLRVPANTEIHQDNGPDFTVTYLILPQLKGQLGIYWGYFPHSFSAGQGKVSKRQDRIGGHEVIWSSWRSNPGLNDEILAETVISEPDNQRFHLFLTAPDEKTLLALQEIVRSLQDSTPDLPERSAHSSGLNR